MDRLRTKLTASTRWVKGTSNVIWLPDGSMLRNNSTAKRKGKGWVLTWKVFEDKETHVFNKPEDVTKGGEDMKKDWAEWVVMFKAGKVDKEELAEVRADYEDMVSIMREIREDLVEQRMAKPAPAIKQAVVTPPKNAFDKFKQDYADKIEPNAYKDAEGYYDVMLKGYCDDHDIGRHAVVDTKLSEVIKRVKRATPCTCDRCKPYWAAKKAPAAPAIKIATSTKVLQGSKALDAVEETVEKLHAQIKQSLPGGGSSEVSGTVRTSLGDVELKVIATRSTAGSGPEHLLQTVYKLNGKGFTYRALVQEFERPAPASETKVVGPKSDNELDAAANWIANYLECSWDITPKFSNVKWASTCLAPLKAVVPMKPTTTKLYRITTPEGDLSVGDTLTLPAQKLLSFTTGKGKSFWENLADEIGASNSKFCYVVEIAVNPVEVFNTAWALGPALKYLKQNAGSTDGTRKLQHYEDYIDQKEVVGYFKTLVQAKIISKF